MIQRMHTGHMGVEKSKSRAQDLLFWPGMGKQIEATVEQCSIRQETQCQPQRSPAVTQHTRKTMASGRNRPFHMEHSKRHRYCRYSRYFELERLTSCTSAAVITKLKSALACHSIAETVISDNGPCYSSEEFRRFRRVGLHPHHHTSALPTKQRSRRKDCPDSEVHPGQGKSWKQRLLPHTEAPSHVIPTCWHTYPFPSGGWILEASR